TKLDREVAIKVLPAAFAQHPDRLARFEREAKVLASLKPNNIATIYAVEESSDGKALVMELVEGGTLKGPVPLDTALKYAAQIASALDAAHEKGITHRDLKPANIMLTPDGTIKVLDFGLAAVTLASQSDGEAGTNMVTLTMSPTTVGMIMGTAAYMSPEQARGQTVDRRADIWAFGVVLWELLTGKQLFGGDTVSDILASLLTKEPDFTRVPSKVRRLLWRCLEKDPKKRLRDIGDAMELVDGDLEAAPAASAAPSRSRLGWLVAGVATIAFATALWAPWRTEKPVDRPLVRLDASLGPDAIQGTDSGVAISPDGTRIVFPIRRADRKPLLATRLLDQAVITPLPGTENANYAFFSPDGQWIGFYADSKLKKVSLRGGAPVTLSDASSSFFGGASWGENGDIVASLSVVGGLQSIPASGGAPHTVTNLGKQEASHLLPQSLPGGNIVLFTAARTTSFEDANIQVVSLKTGAVKTLLSGGYFGRYLSTLPTSGSTGHLVYVRQGVLYAVAFDPVRLEVRGMPEQILEDVGGSVGNPFDFSRNGTFVYHPGTVADQKWPIVWMDSSGKTEPLVTTPGNYSFPRFSPDGTRLALTVDTGKGEEIFVYDRQRDSMSRLTFAGGENRSAVWSRDAEHLVFQSRNAAGSRLNWIRTDGSGEIQVLLESKNNIGPDGFSPDGRTLAYRDLQTAGDNDLWTLPLDTSDPEHPKPSKPVPFLQTPANELWLVFSPDGRYVAYFSNESGSYEVYVRPAPGPDGKPGPGKWQVSTAGGSYPEWSSNGRELFYRGLDNRIMVTDYIANAGAFSSRKPRVWSDRQIRPAGSFLNFALAPDGKRFAVFPMPEPTAEDKGPAHVTFLLNFFDELRRKVPLGK
ncbi:MAG: protein kinase, partial [Bryobacteraceae bacterium]